MYGWSEKKQRIVQAAMEVFSRHAYHLVKMEDIAERAGVGKGTIYEYFCSKDELFLAVAQAGSRLYLAELAAAVSAGQNALEKLRALFCQHLSFVEKHADAARLLAGDRRPPHPDLLQAMLEGRRQLLLLVGGILEEGVKTGEFRELEAAVTVHALTGALTALWAAVLLGELADRDREQVAQTILDLYLAGLAGARPGPGEQ